MIPLFIDDSTRKIDKTWSSNKVGSETDTLSERILTATALADEAIQLALEAQQTEGQYFTVTGQNFESDKRTYLNAQLAGKTFSVEYIGNLGGGGSFERGLLIPITEFTLIEEGGFRLKAPYNANLNDVFQVSGVDFVEADLAGKQNISEKNQPNGYAGLDGNAHVIKELFIDDTISVDYLTWSSQKINSFVGDYQLKSEKGQPEGYAGLDENGKVFDVQIDSSVLAVSDKIVKRDFLGNIYVIPAFSLSSNFRPIVQSTDDNRLLYASNQQFKDYLDLSTDDVEEGSHLYYTEARVDANANVAANTAARHNAVTLGTPNGLSLADQELSLGLASATTAGALSAADWNTFNGKADVIDLDAYQLRSEKGQVNGYPSLDGNTLIPVAQQYVASESQAGIVTVGNQNFKGTKRFYWNADTSRSTTIDGNAISFAGTGAQIGFGTGSTISGSSTRLALNNADQVALSNAGVDHIRVQLAGILLPQPLNTSNSSFSFLTKNLVTGLVESVSNDYFNPYQLRSEKGLANGYTPLDSGAKIPIIHLPDSLVGAVKYKGTYNVITDTPTLPPADASQGFYYIVNTAGTYSGVEYKVGDWIISDGTIWDKVDNSDAVTTVFGRIGNVLANESDYLSFYPLLSGSYANPSWITSLAYSKLTGIPNLDLYELLSNKQNSLVVDGTGTKYATVDAINAYISSVPPVDLSNYVDRTTDQSIGGRKTFNDQFSIDISTDNTDYRTEVEVSQYSILLRNIDPGTEPPQRKIEITDSHIELDMPGAGILMESDGIRMFQLVGTGTRMMTVDPSGLLGVAAIPSLSGYELLTNKQNSLTTDGTGIKYPTVDAINLVGNGLIHTTGTETKVGSLILNSPIPTGNANALTPLTVTGTTGGVANVSSGTAVSGRAGDIVIQTGGGGIVSGTTTGVSTSGRGGNLTLRAGDGGDNAATSSTTRIYGLGGFAVLQAGGSFGNQVAAPAELKAGNNYTTGGARGGSVYLVAGYGNNSTSDDQSYNGSIFLGASSQGQVRGNVVIGSIADDFTNRFQVTGNSKFTGDVTATGNFIGNLTGNAATATSWGGRSAILNAAQSSFDYFLTLGSDNIVRLTNDASSLRTFIGIPSGGETLQSVWNRDPKINAATNVNLVIGVGANPAAMALSAVNDASNANTPLELRGSYINLAPGNVGVDYTTDQGYKFAVNGTGKFAGQLNMPSGIDILFGSTGGVGIGQYFDVASNGIKFYNATGGADLLTLNRSTGNATFSGTVTGAKGIFTAAAGGDVELRNANPYIAWWDAAGTTRKGYIQHSAGVLTIVNDEVGGVAINNPLTVTGSVTSNGKLTFGNGSFSSNTAALYTDATSGTIITLKSGSTNDLNLVNPSGSTILTVPTGAVNAVFAGKITALGYNGGLDLNYNNGTTAALNYYAGGTSSKFVVLNNGNATFAGNVTAPNFTGGLLESNANSGGTTSFKYVEDDGAWKLTSTFPGDAALIVDAGIIATSFTGGAVLTGTPTAPTATAGTNTTQIATTAFVNDAVVSSGATSGTYTPTVTLGSGIASTFSVRTHYYTRVGNIVTVSGGISVTVNSGSGNILCQFELDLPIASNFTNSQDLTGTGTPNQSNITIPPDLNLIANSTTDRAITTVSLPANATIAVYYTYTYIVK